MKHIFFLISFFTFTCEFLYSQHTDEGKLFRQLTRSSERLTKKAVSATVKVLALRVQFQKEVPDKERTTGNGHFDLRDQRAIRTIDPAPHNKRYFEDQLLSMKNYFFDVSDGKLDIDYTVKPDGDTAAYTLTKLMEYYGIRGKPQARDKRLAEFFADAVTQADMSDTIDFSEYDYVIIFHAGAGEDINLDNLTTNDLSSRYVSHQLLRTRFGETYQGVPVNGSSLFVTDGVVVPETESQSFIDPVLGTENFKELGLSGILIANFGSQLGMPDLFNTETGSAGIGYFGLEDQGAFNGEGLIPAEPDPWTKIYMGWAEPVIVSDSFDIHLYPRKLAGQNTILKIPINASEYFLIENKQRDVISNALSPEVISRFDTINNSDGTTTIDTVYMAGIERSPDTKVITKVDEYDSGQPGNGLLVWHIDENIISQKIETNSINNDLYRRGVKVVEGSGSQDIGFGVSSLFGTDIDPGNRFDYFYKGNEGFAFYNNKVDSVFLTPTSVPNTLSNGRANSGIHITQISPIQQIMTFNLRTSLLQKGFPRFTGSHIGNNSIKFGDIAGDAKNEIVAAGTDGKIYAWTSGGGKVISNNYTAVYKGIGKDTIVYQVALFVQASDSILYSPALVDLDNNGKLDVVAVSKGGKVYAWKATDVTPVDGFADSIFVYNMSGDEITTPPVITDAKEIIFGTNSGKVIVLDNNGVSTGTIVLPGAVLNIAVLNNDSVIAVTSSGIYSVNINPISFATVATFTSASTNTIAVGDLLQNGSKTAILIHDNAMQSFLGGSTGFTSLLPESISSPPSLADIDNDGYLEILFAGNNKIYAYNHNGTLVTNFPITIDVTKPTGTIVSTVLVGDVNGDNKSDLIVGTPNGNIYAYETTGKLLSGFPVATGKPILSTPALLDIDNDGDVEIATASEDGFVYVWDLTATYNASKIKWGQYAYDAGNSSLSREQNSLTPMTGDLIPKASAYNYPNPARGGTTTIRYFLTEPASVKIHIFDMAGDLVQTLNGSGITQTDNEVSWNLKKIQSGVYLAKITAKSITSSKKITRTVKIAVTK
ncbi:VCBS repeat-containing protein [bacterium]|nr:VCBS repeat-containing protein [bacterium]